MNTNMQTYFSNVITGDYMHNTIDLVLKEICDNVRTSYGPYGSHGTIQTEYGSESTKDGMKLISAMKCNATIPTSVLNSVLSVSRKQVDEVGDGSTSTAILLRELYVRFRNILKNTNISPSIMKAEIKKAVDRLIVELKSAATEVDDKILYDTLYTSLDGDAELTNKIVQLLGEMTSIDPLILLEYSSTDEHTYELTKGVSVDGTIIRPDIFFGGMSRMSYENPYIAVINGRVDLSPARILELANFTRTTGCDVIFLCTGISEDILTNCVTFDRTNPGLFNRIAFFQMRQTALSDDFKDICAAIGARFIDGDSLKKVQSEQQLMQILANSSGSAEKVTLSEFDAKFACPKSDENQVALLLEEIDGKISQLKKDPSSLNARISDLEARKAFLSNNYAKFYVGGTSSQRKAINYELVSDAISQAASARKHGVVPGCNVVIPKIIAELFAEDNEKQIAFGIHHTILEAISESYVKLFEYIVENKVNCPTEAHDIVEKHIKENGYVPLNLRDSDEHQVWNSADTDRAILEAATDMAVLLATTKSFITCNAEFDVVSKYN